MGEAAVVGHRRPASLPRRRVAIPPVVPAHLFALSQNVWLQAYLQQLGASAAAAAAATGAHPYQLAAAHSAYFGGFGAFPAAATPAVPPPKKQAPGPPGANLFILRLPFEWGENELRGAFAEFGPIVSAMVFTDRMTGQSKGFGFVSYTEPGALPQHAKGQG